MACLRLSCLSTFTGVMEEVDEIYQSCSGIGAGGIRDGRSGAGANRSADRRDRGSGESDRYQRKQACVGQVAESAGAAICATDGGRPWRGTEVGVRAGSETACDTRGQPNAG